MTAKGDPLLEVDRPRQALPDQVGASVDREVARVRAVDGVSLTLHEGRHWAWSANRAAANRRCAGRSCS